MQFLYQAVVGFGSGGSTLAAGFMVERLLLERWEWWMWGLASLPFIALTILSAWRLSKMETPARRIESRLDGWLDLHETFARLPQHDLGEGNACGELPDGATLVRLKDGSFRVALPVRVSGGGAATMGSASGAVLTRKRAPDDS